MTDRSPATTLRRSAMLLGASALLALAACVGLVLEDVARTRGYWPPGRPDVAAILGVLAAVEASRRASGWDRVEPRFRDWLAASARRPEAASAWAMGGSRPTIVVSALLAALLAAWAPHYLTWPFWSDHDVLATLALGWDRGRPPWRDQAGFQFPGEIGLFWAIGRGLGWGSSVAFYATDLAILAALLATVAGSCRACLGRWLPGLAGALAILGYYVTLSFTFVAQRDWHAAELAAVALLLLVAGDSPTRALASSLAYAAALAIRPHAIVLMPAMALAMLAPPRGGPRRRSSMATWAAGLALGLSAAAAPVVLGGLTGDFLRALRFASHSGGAYAGSSVARTWRLLKFDAGDHWTMALLALLLALAVAGPSRPSRRFAAIMLAAVGCVLLYRPLHPVEHLYLRQPSQLIQALAFASIADGISGLRMAARTRLAAFVLMIDLVLPWGSRLLDLRAGARAIRVLATGEETAEAPPGGVVGFPLDHHPARPYLWRDYRAAIAFLRARTGPTTPVANLLTFFPYPAMNASVGRVTPLPVEAISLISWFPDVDFDAPIAAALERSPDAVAIRDARAAEVHFAARLPLTWAALGRSYTPIARFGAIEILRRSPPPAPADGPRLPAPLR